MSDRAVGSMGTAPSEEMGQPEMFMKVACDAGHPTLIKVTDLVVTLGSGDGTSYYSYTCDDHGLQWGETSRQTAALLIGLGAGTEMHAEDVTTSTTLYETAGIR